MTVGQSSLLRRDVMAITAAREQIEAYLVRKK